eukprot:TRINITY_DN2146_c0_g3_i2.p1 TRINITY_DN2146_c0_g3~~TRINITY_DN2146_c0_g3_i2.p1  ORF type:complete len:191 (-),score=53.39 TRINITY_DN2146_c0_g3_i2:68-640(-)
MGWVDVYTSMQTDPSTTFNASTDSVDVKVPLVLELQVEKEEEKAIGFVSNVVLKTIPVVNVSNSSLHLEIRDIQLPSLKVLYANVDFDEEAMRAELLVVLKFAAPVIQQILISQPIPLPLPAKTIATTTVFDDSLRILLQYSPSMERKPSFFDVIIETTFDQLHTKAAEERLIKDRLTGIKKQLNLRFQY